MITINKTTLKNVGIVVLSIIILGLVFLVIKQNPSAAKTENIGTAVESGDKQLISITAKAGFTPSTFTAESNKSTILRVSTKNTFDCSSTVYIPALGINATLPFSGETDFDIPPQVAGTKLEGTCSMGMYSFTINFT